MRFTVLFKSGFLLYLLMFILPFFWSSPKAEGKSFSACRRCSVDWVELRLHVTEISTRMPALYSQTGPWLCAVRLQRSVTDKMCEMTWMDSYPFVKMAWYSTVLINMTKKSAWNWLLPNEASREHKTLLHPHVHPLSPCSKMSSLYVPCFSKPRSSTPAPVNNINELHGFLVIWVGARICVAINSLLLWKAISCSKNTAIVIDKLFVQYISKKLYIWIEHQCC